MILFRKTKILHLGKYFPPFQGGIENFTASLINRGGQDFDIQAIVHQHKFSCALQKIRYKSTPIFKVASFGRLAYAPLAPTFAYYLNRVVIAYQPDIIHIHMPNTSAFYCLLLANVRKIPWVIHWHSDVLGSIPDIKIKLLYPFYRVFERMLLDKAQRIIATSSVYRRTSKPLSRFMDKTAVVPLGIEDQAIEQTPKQANSALRLLMIGRLVYYKGHELMLHALAQLQRESYKIELHLVGSGPEKNNIEKLRHTLNLVDQVFIWGKLEGSALQAHINCCDLVCLPSIERTEAFGLVLLEAMRASKPCLVSDVPGSGMSWVVEHLKTGWVIKHNDAQHLIWTLKEVYKQPELLPLFGKNGRKRFEQHFHIDQVHQQIAKIYHSVLETCEPIPDT